MTTRTPLKLGTDGLTTQFQSGDTVPVLNGGTGTTTSTGTGSVVLSDSPTLTGTVSAAAISTTGLVKTGGGILEQSSLIARFEGTGGGRPSGSTGTGFELYTFAGEGYFQSYTVGTGFANVRMTGAAYKFDSVGTTVSAANAYLDPAANNSLLRSTSSETYKLNVAPIDPTDARTLIMGLNPINFTANPAFCPNDNPNLVRYGFGAIATAKVSRAFAHFGYHAWDYDTSSGRVVLKPTATPSPTGIQEAAILATLTTLVQQLVKDNDALKARVTALESQH